MTQTSLNIGSIGQQLESARQSKGVSVSEAGRATRILSKFIEAMENDDFGALSAPVYAKSFIKMYARYLGLDAEPLVEEYVAQHASQSSPQLSEEVRQNLAQVDSVAIDASGNPIPPTEGQGKSILSGFGAAVTGLGEHLSPRVLMVAAGALLVLILFAVGVSQCTGDENDEPAPAGGAAREERPVVSEQQPDVYLVKPGIIEVEQ